MRNSMINVQYLLLALLLFALTACGENSNTVATSNLANGKVTVKLQWPEGKTSAKSVALITDVMTVRLVVTGNGIPTARAEVAKASGTNPTVEVYPGSNLIVAAYGIKADGTMLYEGFVTGVSVASGATTDVGTISLTPVVVKATDTNCINCHETIRDITGQNLVADYKQSGHYTNLTWVANAKNGSTNTGCAGCHGIQHNDVAPAANGRCFECHSANLSLKHTSATALTAGEANPARYLNLTGTNCSACHEPHNPINGVGNQQRTDWEASGHGDINAAPWTHYDFTIRDTCNSCHTAAGFSKAVGNNFTDKTALSTTTLGKQPLTCDGCHSSNDFKGSVRQLTAAFVAPYTPSLGASATFPGKDVIGNSQLCIPCHAGLVSGNTINSLPDAGMNNVSFQNSHYMAAAGLMYVKAGFANFTSAGAVIGTSTYGQSLTSNDDGGALTSTHRKLGTAAMATDSHVGGRGLITGGPCVTCHMPKAGHTWAINADSFNGVCVNCHTTEGTTTLTANNFRTVFIDEQSAVFQDALNLALATLLNKYNISFNQAAYPYFYDNNLSPVGAVKDWTRGGALSAAEAKKLMGACFNINILKREPAAYAHARTYARRLLYDSIDFLDNKTMDMSVGATAIAYNQLLYVKGATATDATTTEAFKYLAGYNRTSGAWNTLERP